MTNCNRLVATWILILAFQLSLSSTFSCRFKKYREVIQASDGYKCKQTRVKLGRCVGMCDSHAIPIPIGDDGVPKFQTECKCCAPKEIREKTFRFSGEGCDKSIVVSQIRSCECKNCSRRDLWELQVELSPDLKHKNGDKKRLIQETPLLTLSLIHTS